MKSRSTRTAPPALLCAAAMAFFTGCGDSAPLTTLSMRGGAGCGITADAGSRETAPETIRLSAGRGGEPTEARYWRARNGIGPNRVGIIFVSGVDGGFIEPADGIYARIAAHYSEQGVPSVFVKYRAPGEVEPSVEDAIAAADYLRKQCVTRMAIAGWSFGGAVITHSAARLPEIAAILGFAPQARDTEPVARLRAGQSLLLIHSDTDENVPFESSKYILDEAPTSIRKELIPVEGADHLLTGEGDRLAPIVFKWMDTELNLRSRCQ